MLLEVQKALDFESQSGALYRTQAFILDNLDDPYRAIDSFRKAVGCKEKDYCAQLRLAELLREENHLEEAVEQTTPLVDSAFLSDSDVSIRNRARLFRAHYVSMLWLKKYSNVLEISEGWLNKGDLRPAHLALRVSAIQRILDDGELPLKDAENRIEEMIGALDEGFKLDGYMPETVHEGFRALDRLCRMEARTQLTEESILLVANFLDAHLPAMCGSSNEYSLGDEFIKELVSRFQLGGNNDNPLRKERWSDLVIFGQVEDQALSGFGYVSARITKRMPSYFFAQALEGSSAYFVHRAATDLSISRFADLKDGQLVQILPSDVPPEAGRARLAKHAMLD